MVLQIGRVVTEEPLFADEGDIRCRSVNCFGKAVAHPSLHGALDGAGGAFEKFVQWCLIAVVDVVVEGADKWFGDVEVFRAQRRDGFQVFDWMVDQGEDPALAGADVGHESIHGSFPLPDKWAGRKGTPLRPKRLTARRLEYVLLAHCHGDRRCRHRHGCPGPHRVPGRGKNSNTSIVPP